MRAVQQATPPSLQADRLELATPVMTRDYLRSRFKADALSSLTAFFFCLMPAIAVLLALVAAGAILRIHVPNSSSATHILWIGVALLLAVLVAVATVRVRKMVEGIRREGERYRVALESAADGILIVDSAGKVLEADAAVSAMLGYSPKKLLDLGLDELAHGGEQHGAVSPSSELLSEWTLLREYRLRQSDGALRPVEVNSKALDDGRIMIIIRDISARKRVEESLKVSELRYRLLFKGNLAGVYRATAAGACWSAINRLPPCSAAHRPEKCSPTTRRTSFPLRKVSNLSRICLGKSAAWPASNCAGGDVTALPSGCWRALISPSTKRSPRK